jgi:hypothetical protein
MGCASFTKQQEVELNKCTTKKINISNVEILLKDIDQYGKAIAQPPSENPTTIADEIQVYKNEVLASNCFDFSHKTDSAPPGQYKLKITITDPICQDRCRL